MSRSALNLFVDCVLLAILLCLMFCAVVVRFVFPPSSEAVGWKLWGLGFDQWSNLHFSLVAALSLGVLLHLMLHWSWVCGFIVTRIGKNKKAKLDEGMQTIYGVAVLLVLLNVLGVAIAAATLTALSELERSRLRNPRDSIFTLFLIRLTKWSSFATWYFEQEDAVGRGVLPRFGW